MYIYSFVYRSSGKRFFFSLSLKPLCVYNTIAVPARRRISSERRTRIFFVLAVSVNAVFKCYIPFFSWKSTIRFALSRKRCPDKMFPSAFTISQRPVPRFFSKRHVISCDSLGRLRIVIQLYRIRSQLYRCGGIRSGFLGKRVLRRAFGAV